MQKDDLNTIKFAGIVCLACSMALAGVKGSLNGIQVKNAEMDRQVNILKALSPSFSPDGEELTEEQRDEYFLNAKVPKEWIPQYFDEYVTIQSEGLPAEVPSIEAGQAPELYTLRNDKKEIVSVVFYAEGKGLWSTVKSYVGLEPDLETIRGVTFFGHKETPGLGGECSKPWFQKNFQGKKLGEDGDPLPFEVVKGKAAEGAVDEVDGMSGATITGKGIERFLNKIYRTYNQEVFVAMRGEAQE